MSRFDKAVPILVALTGAPIFLRMIEENRAYPLAVGIGKDLREAAGEGERARIRKALHILSTSRRYRQAVATEGSLRYLANGNVAGPVTEQERAWTMEQIAKTKAFMAARKTARAAAKVAVDPPPMEA